MLERLPKELFLEILKWLAQDDETTQGSRALLNIARSSRSFYNCVNSWVHTTAKLVAADLQYLDHAIAKTSKHQSSFIAISAFCKRIGKICATCNNRARHSRDGEMFTKLQLCTACESFLFPKISSTRLRTFFDISPNAKPKRQCSEETLNSFRQAIQKPRRKIFFRWSDVEEIILDGSLTLNPTQVRINQICGRWLSLEECSEFRSYGSEVTYWSSRQRLFLWTLWRNSVFHWNRPDGRDKFCAIDVELILFKEFRYQFDSSWPPTRTEDEDLKVYSTFARYWAINQLVWQDRPWRLQNFPLPPRCSISNPHTNEDDLREDNYDLAHYQNQCSRFRAVIKAFPDILRCPEIWRRCVSNKKRRNSIPEAVEMALSAARAWKESKETKIGFEIRPHSHEEPWLDVRFVRKGKDIKPTVFPLRFPVWGNIRDGSIIQIDGDSVEVISPVITRDQVSWTMKERVDTNEDEESSDIVEFI